MLSGAWESRREFSVLFSKEKYDQLIKSHVSSLPNEKRINWSNHSLWNSAQYSNDIDNQKNIIDCNFRLPHITVTSFHLCLWSLNILHHVWSSLNHQKDTLQQRLRIKHICLSPRAFYYNVNFHFQFLLVEKNQKA